MTCLLRVLALAGLLASPPLPAVAGTVWLCGLSDDLVRLVCVADTALDTVAEPQAPAVRVNGTAFPLDPRRSWTVDLWSPPSELAMVETLARATICYRSPGCEVVLRAPALEAVAPTHAQRTARAR